MKRSQNLLSANIEEKKCSWENKWTIELRNLSIGAMVHYKFVPGSQERRWLPHGEGKDIPRGWPNVGKGMWACSRKFSEGNFQYEFVGGKNRLHLGSRCCIQREISVRIWGQACVTVIILKIRLIHGRFYGVLDKRFWCWSNFSSFLGDGRKFIYLF